MRGKREEVSKMEQRERTCQHQRWYKLPSGKRGSVTCGKPAKEYSHIVRTGLQGLAFNMIEALCDEHKK